MTDGHAGPDRQMFFRENGLSEEAFFYTLKRRSAG